MDSEQGNAHIDEFGFLAPIPASEGQRRAPPEGFFTGPEVGTRLPDFELRSASGEMVRFHSDRKQAKAAVVFFRSAVWCPLCMTQLVELQEALPKFNAAGIKLYAVSYDEAHALADFARHHAITYTLLSDMGSKVIDLFGIRNHFVTKEQVPYYGIPFPGTYLVDEQGIVTAKFFQRNIAQRESAEAIIDSALGEILLGNDEPHSDGGSDDIRITASYHGGGGRMKAGVMREIVVRFDLAPGLHIYSDPVPRGMIATKIRVSGPPGLHVGEIVAPKTHTLKLPGLGSDLHVWSGRVDFVLPVYADHRIASIVHETRRTPVEIEVHIEYQACDDQACRLPKKETLTLQVPIEPHIGNVLAGKLPGTLATGMSSRWFMLKQILRGLRQSPLRGLKYLLTLGLKLVRTPAPRRVPQ